MSWQFYYQRKSPHCSVYFPQGTVGTAGSSHLLPRRRPQHDTRINRGYYKDQVIDSWPSSVIDSEKNVSNRQNGSYGILASWTLANQFTRLQHTWKKAVQKFLAGQSISLARGTTEPIITFDVSAVISPCWILFIPVYIHHFLMENWIPALSATCCFCLLPGAAEQWTKENFFNGPTIAPPQK